jgi:hypothetical protein
MSGHRAKMASAGVASKRETKDHHRKIDCPNLIRIGPARGFANRETAIERR